ncbi:MAG TPA: FecR domain-containing protein, partial [Capsulimonadaceae bacterium]|nr:FecR domain-containing protein [Capsulimonadaceae bacterium]
MKNQRCIARRAQNLFAAAYTRFLAPLALVCLLANVAAAAGGPTPDTPPVGQKAGKITALLPTAHVVRGAGKTAVTTDAKKGDELVWQDLVKTDKGGRARITLNDQSILSLGSQAELRIVKQDAAAQQTSLEMSYGRVRAQVEKVTRDGGSFQVRTPTAVAGVIGTDFGTDASEPGETTFICISGLVQVGNADPRGPGTVPCAAGQTTTVKTGVPPSPPKPATIQQINQLLEDTTAATISAFAPASALIGTTLDSIATGTHMGGIKGVTVSGSGIQASLGPNGTATSVTAHLAISTGAQAGPHIVTFTKPNGADTAAVFTVIAPAAPQGTDAASLKKRYTDILTSEQQAAQSSDASIKAGLQQEIDTALQAIEATNSRLPQPLSPDQVTQQLETLVNSLNLANFQNQESQAFTNAGNGLDGIVAAIETKLADKSEPAANLLPDLDKAFAPINQAYLTALSQV